MEALAAQPVGAKLHLGRLADQMQVEQGVLIKEMERLIAAAKVDRDTLRPFVDEEEAVPSGAELVQQIKEYCRSSGETFGAFRTRAGISYASPAPLAKVAAVGTKVLDKVRAAMAVDPTTVVPPRRGGVKGRVVKKHSATKVEGLDGGELPRRIKRDQEMLADRKRDIVCHAKEREARFSTARQTGTVRSPLPVKRTQIGDQLRSIGNDLDLERLANVQDVMREIGRRWPADWQRVVAIAKTEGVMAGIMLHRVVEAGLDCMEASE